MGFLRKWVVTTTEAGESIIYLSGPDQNELLKRRIVAYPSGSEETYASKDASGNQTADGAMVAIARENLGPDATDTDRDYSANGFDVKWDDNRGPTIQKAFAWKNADRVLSEFGQTARAMGTEIFYGIHPVGVNADGTVVLKFMALDQPPGGDRSWKSEPLAKSMIFGLRWGNLLNPAIEYDYSNEVNYVYAGGPGEGLERQVVEVEDATRVSTSAWNRREAFADARQAKTTAEITAKANEVLNAGRPRIRFTGTILSTEQTPYGEWELGSRVTIEYRNLKFNGLVRNVQVSVDSNGRETVFSQVEYEGEIE